MDKKWDVLLKASDGDYDRFIINIEENDYTDTSMSFEVREVNCWPYEPDDPEYVEHYISGMINWDGCSHIYFGGKDENGSVDGYLHLCGKSFFKDHCDVMMAVYALAEKKITKYNKTVAE